MLELYFVLYALIAAKITAYIALLKQRNTEIWYLIGFTTGIIGLLAVMIISSLEDEPLDEIRDKEYSLSQ